MQSSGQAVGSVNDSPRDFSRAADAGPGSGFPSNEWQDPPPTARRVAGVSSVVSGTLLLIGIVMRLSAVFSQRAEMAGSRETAAAAASQAPEIDAVRPTAAQYAKAIDLTGNLDPIEAADMSFTLGGRISKVLVSMGQTVRQGSPLVLLDRRTVGAQAATTDAAIGVAEANLVMLRDQVETLRRLSQTGAAPARQLTTAEQQLAVAEAQLLQARSGRRQVSTAVADHTLLAPFSGVVTRVPTGIGGMAGPGVPIARIEDLRRMKLRTSVGESDLLQLRVGTIVLLESGARGTITNVVRSLDAQTRRAPIEIEFDNQDERLIAHAFVRARAQVGEAQSALRIPASSRRPNGMVYLVATDGRVTAREVEAYSDPADGSWLVLRGLTAADQVVLRPAQTTEGVTVRVRAPRAATPPSAAATGDTAATH